MKKIDTIFIVLFGSILFGQEYTPMLREDNLWTVERIQYNGEDYDTYYPEFQLNDQTIFYNQREYTGMEVEVETYQLIYLHENVDEKKVYIYYPEDPGTSHEYGEFVLYDFNLQVGDLVPLEGFVNFQDYEIRVASITYEDVFGLENIKTFHLDFSWDDIKIYEGIGLSTGPVTFQDGLEGSWRLYDFNNSLNLTEQSKTQTKIYPNPFSDKIQIQNSEEINELQLFDLQGKLISTTQNLEELNSKLSSLNNAVYFLKIQFKNNKSETIKLIKNK